MSITIYAVSLGQYDDFSYVGFFTKMEDAADLVQEYKKVKKYPENTASWDELDVCESLQEHYKAYEE